MKTTTIATRFALLAALVLTSIPATSAARASAEDDLLTLPAPAATMTAEQWKSFSHSLEQALASGHLGLQQSAMRLAVQYSDQVDIKGSIVDLMRLYRTSDDDNVRRLAVVTLASVGSRLATNYLRLSEQYEANPAIRRTIRAVLSGATS